MNLRRLHNPQFNAAANRLARLRVLTASTALALIAGMNVSVQAQAPVPEPDPPPAPAASASQLQFPNVPLFLGQESPPNILFTIDNSGSMDWEIMTTGHWEYDAYDPDESHEADFNVTDQGDFRDDGTWRSSHCVLRIPGTGGSGSGGGPGPTPGDNQKARAGSGSSIGGISGSGTKNAGANNVAAFMANDLRLDCERGNFFYLFDHIDGGGQSDNVQSASTNQQQRCDGVFNVAEACVDPGIPDVGGFTPDANNTPIGFDWRVMSSGLNRVYYNPDLTYQPWKGPCAPGADASGTDPATPGAPCADASFASALSNPYDGQPGNGITRNLGADMGGTGADGSGRTGTARGGFRYEVWIDDKGFNEADGRPRRGNLFNAVPSADCTSPLPEGCLNSVDLWDSHTQLVITGTDVTVNRVTYDPQRNGGTRGLNETTQQLATFTDVSMCYNVLGTQDQAKAAVDLATATAVDGPGCRTIPQAQQNIANWFTYFRRRSFAAKAAIAEVLAAEANSRYAATTLSDPGDASTGTDFFKPVPADDVDKAIHNDRLLSDLFSYQWEGLGTPLRRALQKSGEYFMNGISSGANTAPSPITLDCQKNFTVLLTDGFYNGGNPSLAAADTDEDGVNNTLADVALQFYENPLRTDLPTGNVKPTQIGVIKDDNRNLHMVTMGVAFGVNGLLDADEDGLVSAVVNGTFDPTMTYNIKGEVIPKSRELLPDTAGTPGPGGVSGWGDPGDEEANGEKIDDLRHASLNSRGLFTSAATPDELTSKLVAALAAIGGDPATGAATAQSSSRLNAGARIYNAIFDPDDWSGTIQSLRLQDGSSPPGCENTPRLGTVCGPEWDTGSLLAARDPASRQMITLFKGHVDRTAADADPGNIAQAPSVGVPFRTLADLSFEQQVALIESDEVFIAAPKQERIDFLRGDDKDEVGVAPATAPVQFRERNGKKLGDIIASDPLLVNGPAFAYRDSLETAPYSAFRSQYQARTPMIYAGANDGALHGFNAQTGEEVFAYIPNEVFPRLKDLTDEDYNSSHQFYVDGDSVQGDAFFRAPGTANPAWHSVLVGTLGLGGRGLFALNITNPDDAANAASDPRLDQAEANAANVVLWEFTSQDDVLDPANINQNTDLQLGYTIGKPSILRMNNGRWAVVIGNGYGANDTSAPGQPALESAATLFILFLDADPSDGWTQGPTGDYIKIRTGVISSDDPIPGRAFPNGLGEITAIDVNGDAAADYIYGGDLFGNLWRFDVRSTDAAQWSNPDNFGILFTTEAPAEPGGNVSLPQPITSRVTVGPHPTEAGAVLVYFGTGKYLEVTDNFVGVDANGDSTDQTQTFYAIRDRLPATLPPQAEEILPGVPDPVADEDGKGFVPFNRNSDLTMQNLLQQTILFEDTRGLEISQQEIDWTQHSGWFLDLVQGDGDFDPATNSTDNQGRRVATGARLRDGRVFFVSIIPAGSSLSCAAGGSSILFSLDADNGSGASESIFDINGDENFDESDLLDADNDSVASGIRVEGLAQLPSFVDQPGSSEVTNLYIGSTEGLQGDLFKGDADPFGRQSWRQLK